MGFGKKQEEAQWVARRFQDSKENSFVVVYFSHNLRIELYSLDWILSGRWLRYSGREMFSECWGWCKSAESEHVTGARAHHSRFILSALLFSFSSFIASRIVLSGFRRPAEKWERGGGRGLEEGGREGEGREVVGSDHASGTTRKCSCGCCGEEHPWSLYEMGVSFWFLTGGVKQGASWSDSGLEFVFFLSIDRNLFSPGWTGTLSVPHRLRVIDGDIA